MRTINRQYDDSFAVSGAKIGASLKVRLPNRYTVTTGSALSTQDTTESSVTLTVATQKHVDTVFSSAELTLSIQDFTKRILDPGVSILASQVDYDAMSMALGIANVVGTAGTTPSSAKVLLDAQAKMNSQAAPLSPRYAAVDPFAQAALIDGLKGLFNPTGVVSEQYREGAMADNQLGFREIYMTQSIRNLTTGARNTAYVTTGTTPSAEGVATIAVGTGAGAMTVGEVFTVAGINSVNPETKADTGQLQQFTVTAAYTGGAGNISVAPAMYTVTTPALQNITASVGAGAVITSLGAASTVYPQNIAYHRDAFLAAFADLDMPENVRFGARQVQDGISLRVLRDYRIGTDDTPARIDVLYGYVIGRQELACRITG
jgi:hypothetical protein